MSKNQNFLFMFFSNSEFLFKPLDMVLGVSQGMPYVPVHVVTSLSVQPDDLHILDLRVFQGHHVVSLCLERLLSLWGQPVMPLIPNLVQHYVIVIVELHHIHRVELMVPGNGDHGHLRKVLLKELGDLHSVEYILVNGLIPDVMRG